MNQAFVGIDPGVNGAIAIIYPSTVDTFYIPMKNADIDIEKTLDELASGQLDDFETMVYIERVYFPNKVVRIASILEGILNAWDMEVHLVSPSTWRKEIFGDKEASKKDAVNFSKENYPDINLLRTARSKVPDHNLAEAVCIAEYAKRKHFVSEDQR